MNWLKAFVSSSVGRKYFMGFTGLFLCLFLVVHLAGNVLLFVSEDAYNHYAHNLHANEELLRIIEVILYAAFAIHIFFAIWLQFMNRGARDERYAMSVSKRGDRVMHSNWTPDKTMLWTGILALPFLILHVLDFAVEYGWSEALRGAEPFAKAKIILAANWRQAVYLIGSVVIGYHVVHGLQSAFQSVGLNHPKYTPAIRYLSWLFGIIVAVGFGSFPLIWMRIQ